MITVARIIVTPVVFAPNFIPFSAVHIFAIITRIIAGKAQLLW